MYLSHDTKTATSTHATTHSECAHMYANIQVELLVSNWQSEKHCSNDIPGSNCLELN